MITELGIFYNNFQGKKISYSTFWRRVTQKGYSYEEAISPISKKRIQAKIDCNGRICNKCKTYKYWASFSKGRSFCKECQNKVMRESYNKNKEKINESRAKRRNKLKDKLDVIFYRDKNIQKIISLESPIKRHKRKFNGDIKKDKFFYFLSRGYDRELLTTLYGNHYL